MGKKTVQFSLRMTAEIADIIKKESIRTKRSFNNQLFFWLVNGGVPAELMQPENADLHDSGVKK